MDGPGDSPDLRVATGDTIDGSIERRGASLVWDVTSRVTSDPNAGPTSPTWRNTTLISHVDPRFAFNYADVTLEVYNVTSCDEMPGGGEQGQQGGGQPQGQPQGGGLFAARHDAQRRHGVAAADVVPSRPSEQLPDKNGRAQCDRHFYLELGPYVYA